MKYKLLITSITALLPMIIFSCTEEKVDPCKGGWLDEESGFCWEDPPHSESLNWQLASNYCQKLDLGGYTDWMLPHIDELRSLVQGCEASELNGSCPLTDGSNTEDDTADCDGCEDLKGPGNGGCYWDPDLNGECTDWYWSYSWTEVYGWRIDFGNAAFGAGVTNNLRSVRCFRYTTE